MYSWNRCFFLRTNSRAHSETGVVAFSDSVDNKGTEGISQLVQFKVVDGLMAANGFWKLSLSDGVWPTTDEIRVTAIENCQNMMGRCKIE